MFRVIAKKKDHKSLLTILNALSKIRLSLAGSELAREICIEHGKDPSLLIGVPIDFSKDVESSAVTEDGRIVLNETLLDGEFEILMRYVIHELVHVMQHIDGGAGDRDEDYLDRESELEAFRYQIEYDSANRSEEDVEEYIEGLLDFHDISGKDRGQKEKELMKRVE
jgi:hypothetical protein|tara:strand:- start:4953 stop:5453 length:501 start_codon:yes stop_codon:yes gene_type:complete